MQELSGKVTLVTGAGRGLGEAICHTLSEAGATIVAADICANLAEGLAEKLKGQGREVMPLCFDVGDEKQVEEAFQNVVARYGKLDVLVNNAGTDLTVPIEEMPFEQWDRIVRTNLRGPFVTSKLALAHMKNGTRGQIVNIVSTAAKRAWANAAAYHASKWGLLGFTYALHVEARKQGIKVTAVIAGGMRTPFLLDRFPDLDPGLLQDPKNVADTVRYVLTLPEETVIPEIMVIPMRETSWP